jgi:hypothetical protein
MLNPQRTLEREAMLKRIPELDAEIAQHERNLQEGEARLPLQEQLRLNPAASDRSQSSRAGGKDRSHCTPL